MKNKENKKLLEYGKVFAIILVLGTLINIGVWQFVNINNNLITLLYECNGATRFGFLLTNVLFTVLATMPFISKLTDIEMKYDKYR